MTTPELTVSILVYGPSEYLPDVIDAVRTHTTVRYELILVDNGTDDATRDFMAKIDDARVVQPGRNLGFAAGHDNAANLARGRSFCPLNSDAIVPQAWAERLLAPLDDPGVGATMPVFVYPDGRLQESGATVEPSGQVIAFGRFQDPEKADYRLAGPMPFATAACTVMRTATFRRAGSFDARYGVAYYEDVDLAFALRARGQRVELVADVRVVHAQGASSTTSRDAEQLLLGNRERFRNRYAPFLAGRPEVYGRAEAHHIAAARDFDLCDRLLFVIDTLPGPNDGTAMSERLAGCRRQLAGGRVTVAVRTVDGNRRDAWLAQGVEVVALGDLDALLRFRQFHFAAIATAPDFRAQLANLLAETQPQAVVAELPGDEPTIDPDALAAWLGSLDLVPTLRPRVTGAKP